MLTRRETLKNILLGGGFVMLPFGRSGWALAAPEPSDRCLVVILMRGAVDGLSLVAPYREQNYYNARSTIAIASPGNSDGLIDLDGFFGLHPSLAPLMPIWQNKTLAFIHACGSPATTRSHFEAQDILETALLNSSTARQGWMNELAQTLPDNHAATRTLSFGNVLPKIFQGPYNVSTVPTGFKAGANGGAQNPQVSEEFSRLYGGSAQLGSLYKQGVTAREDMSQDLHDEMTAANQGAPPADAFVAQAAKAGNMLRNDKNIQLLSMDVGGWDTHVGQGNAKAGRLTGLLQHMGDGIAALVQGLGDRYNSTTILVMSEFGRTVAQNGSNGTDHGHGNVAWVMGGNVKGGKVYSRWPGLNPNNLYEGRDLAVTTDFRSVIGATLSGHFGLDDASIARVIAGYQPDTGLNGIIG